MGEETLAALNVPVDARIQQLRANLERCRWLLRDLPATFALVDMAGYRGYYYLDDEIIWRARVQIGTPYDAAPSFRSDIKYIVSNPTWTVRKNGPSAASGTSLTAVGPKPFFYQSLFRCS